jgi:hypothetical protein
MTFSVFAKAAERNVISILSFDNGNYTEYYLSGSGSVGINGDSMQPLQTSAMAGIAAYSLHTNRELPISASHGPDNGVPYVGSGVVASTCGMRSLYSSYPSPVPTPTSSALQQDIQCCGGQQGNRT